MKTAERLGRSVEREALLAALLMCCTSFRSPRSCASRERGAYDVRVFGSRARGDATPTSDLDLLVKFEPARSLLDLVGMKLDLEGLLGIRVDVVSEPGLSPYIRDHVLAEARPLAA